MNCFEKLFLALEWYYKFRVQALVSQSRATVRSGNSLTYEYTAFRTPILIENSIPRKQKDLLLCKITVNFLVCDGPFVLL